MPGVPIEMPSDTVIVLKTTLFAPAASMPAAASFASSAMCTLQGVRFDQVDATPIWDLPKSASSKPTARSIARAGAAFRPSTTRLECARVVGAACPCPLLGPFFFDTVAFGRFKPILALYLRSGWLGVRSCHARQGPHIYAPALRVHSRAPDSCQNVRESPVCTTADRPLDADRSGLP